MEAFNNMTTTDSQSVINDNSGVIETFVSSYLMDLGIQVQLVEAVAKELFGQRVVDGTVPEGAATSPKELVSTAVTDIIDVGAFSGAKYDLQRVVDGAASLEFLVRYARKVDPAVFPPEVIPSDEVVQAALKQFHTTYQRGEVIDTTAAVAS